MQLQLSDTFSISAILFFMGCPYPALAITFPHCSLLPFCGDPNKTYDLSIMLQHQHIPRWQVFFHGYLFCFSNAENSTSKERRKKKQIQFFRVPDCSRRCHKERQGFFFLNFHFFFCHPAGSQSRAVPFASCLCLMKVNLISWTSWQIPSNVWWILPERRVPSSWPSATKKRQLCPRLGTEMSCFKWSFSPLFLRLHRSDLARINPPRITM